MKTKAGLIFLFVLGMLSVLSFIAVLLVNSSHQTLNYSKAYFNKVRTNNMLHSGIEFAQEKVAQDLLYFVPHNKPEVFRLDDGLVNVVIEDKNGKININDGIIAGYLEVNERTGDDFSVYHSNALDPWPKSDQRDPLYAYRAQSENLKNVDRLNQARSALINLRLRRILNAYGDAHRFADSVFDNDLENITLENYYQNNQLPNPVYSISASSSDAQRGQSMTGVKNLTLSSSYNNGLGDRIIESRPPDGYEELDEIEDIVNTWSQDEGIELSQNHLKGQSFFELIKNDLTTQSYEDNQFFRIYDEGIIGQYTPTLAHIPKNIGTSRIDFSGRSQGFFKPHSIALINMNQASFYVKAAAFYAPTNVSLLSEGIKLKAPYHGHQGTRALKKSVSVESLSPSPTIGVVSPLFSSSPENRKYYENGQAVGRDTHLMSLRDAMNLSYWYEQYSQIQSPHYQKSIVNFDDFKNFLTWFSDPLNSAPIISAFEKAVALSILPNPSSKIHFNKSKRYQIGLVLKGGYHCAKDYGAKILPHVLSCIRRIPGFLGAPIALTSPFAISFPDQSVYYNDNTQPKLCARKVEDFVWRFTHPKISFLPSGIYNLEVKSEIRDQRNYVVSLSELQATIQLFKTKILRTQIDFETYKDNINSHNDIKIGPEVRSLSGSNIPKNGFSPYLGCIGLHDFDHDIELDKFMTFGQGYFPHIVLNFDPRTNPASDFNGYENSSSNQITHPDPAFFNQKVINGHEGGEVTIIDDPWIDAIGLEANLLKSSFMEGSKNNVFNNADYNECDLSPFNGVFFTSISNDSYFNDCLYWRLNQLGWLEENQPTASNLAAGNMTFWFRIPTDYDYTFPIKIVSTNELVDAHCASRTLACLNLWESFQFFSGGSTFYRPVTLTVGLRKNALYGLNVFARYDTSGQPITSAVAEYPYIGPITEEGDFSQLAPSLATTNGVNAQYNYLGLLCLLGDHSPESNSYLSYRMISHKCFETSVSFEDQEECRPGSWHRVSVGWNFRWPGETLLNNERLNSTNQLWIHLLDNTSQSIEHHRNNFRQSYTYDPNALSNAQLTIPPIVNPQNFEFIYPGSNDIEDLTDAARGFMAPFDSAMVLSLGETLGRDLTSGKYMQNWRLNSSIDNFRLHLGSSDPNKNDPEMIDKAYLSPNGYPYSKEVLKESIYTAMRYNVTSVEAHGEHGIETDNEPEYLIDLELKKGSKLFAIGARIYNPPDSNNNYPYVAIRAKTFDYNQEKSVIPWSTTRVPDNEQDVFFNAVKIDKNFKISLQYTSFKPQLNDGILDNKGGPLEYMGIVTSKGHQGDNFTNLPWIKEVSLRYRESDNDLFLDRKVIK